MAINDSVLNFLMKRSIKGRDRLYGLLLKLGFRSTVLSDAKYGIKLYLNPHEHIDKVIFKEGFYESEITDELLACLQLGDTFWDIGANIGIHSIAVKKNLPGVKVYSFEPNPKTVSRLYDNVGLNELDITVCGFALFETIGSMALHINEGNSGMSTLTPWHEAKFHSMVQCLTTTGDTLLSEGFDAPTAIKLDTEGSELNVLKGCRQLLASPSLKLILIEANNNLLDNVDSDETVVFLKQFGFDHIKRLERNEKTHHGLSNFAVTRA
jgi:FkbM family methyltransferase